MDKGNHLRAIQYPGLCLEKKMVAIPRAFLYRTFDCKKKDQQLQFVRLRHKVSTETRREGGPHRKIHWRKWFGKRWATQKPSHTPLAFAQIGLIDEENVVTGYSN